MIKSLFLQEFEKEKLKIYPFEPTQAPVFLSNSQNEDDRLNELGAGRKKLTFNLNQFGAHTVVDTERYFT